jgi:hypothetical protein
VILIVNFSVIPSIGALIYPSIQAKILTFIRQTYGGFMSSFVVNSSADAFKFEIPGPDLVYKVLVIRLSLPK